MLFQQVIIFFIFPLFQTLIFFLLLRLIYYNKQMCKFLLLGMIKIGKLNFIYKRKDEIIAGKFQQENGLFIRMSF